MNTITGDCLTTETGGYSDEVLNANWLPQMVLAALGLRAANRTNHECPAVDSDSDAEDFMKRLYRAQE
ncbi:hypothetical protein GCM10027046_29410 [Uliginosibacterium flavum]|uniref:Histone deacetylase domain-containing protein n=1 Tax=Uliginosibacterium flavum TaxID=1396831 RepID=A0ABV2TJ32_9RHOO